MRRRLGGFREGTVTLLLCGQQDVPGGTAPRKEGGVRGEAGTKGSLQKGSVGRKRVKVVQNEEKGV